MAYTVPTADDLRARFPAFADVADETIDYWLTDAQLIVTTSWIEADYAPAMMALAAHNMAVEGLAAPGSTTLPAGLTMFRSGDITVQQDAETARAQAGGGYDSTRYGIAFKTFLRRNRGGPFVAASPAASDCC